MTAQGAVHGARENSPHARVALVSLAPSKVHTDAANFNHKALPAAVFRASDPRSSDCARVMPDRASLLTVGNAILGYYSAPQHARHDPKLNAKGWPSRMAVERQKELRKLANYRRLQGLAMGPADHWILVLANLCGALRREVTVDAIKNIAVFICYNGPINASIATGLIRDTALAARVWSTYPLFQPDECGHLLEVTIVERDECGLRKIGSCEETAPQRKKRRDRETSASKRAAKGVASRKKSVDAAEPWVEMGISKSTFYRRKHETLKSLHPPMKALTKL